MANAERLMAVMAPFSDGAEREVDEALIAAIIAAAEARTTPEVTGMMPPVTPAAEAEADTDLARALSQ